MYILPVYQVPAKTQQSELVIKKSRFIAIAGFADDRNTALQLVAQCQQNYPDASHHCWAYQLGDPASPYSAAMSDDGEPSGTAGKPILNVLQHKDIGNVAIVVSRYFGGIKLGAGGLVRAYSAAAQQVMEQLSLQTYVAKTLCNIDVDFAHEQELRYWLSKNEGALIATEYSTVVSCQIEVPQQQLTTLRELALQHSWVLTMD